MSTALSTHAAPTRGAAVFLPAVTSLAWREIVRFFRQRNRVIGAIATPVVFWLLLGFGANNAFNIEPAALSAPSVSASADATGEVVAAAATAETAASVGYLEFFFPGAVLMMVLFTAIFSTITVIEDRKEGFLQSVLASPASRTAIVLGKVLGGAAIATAQGLVMLVIGVLLFRQPGLLSFVPAVAVMFVVAVGLTALGLCIAWPMSSTAGFHAVMNILLMPMWFLSGAVFPLTTAAGPIRGLMYLNPLTYGQALFAAVLQGDRAPDPGMPLALAAVVTVLSTAAAVAGAARLANRG